jgi:galactan 5-O-arabinofuranosyltransferase
MLEVSWIGALCLLGFVFLVLTAREAVSRSLLIVTVALYVWHAIGYPFLVIDRPLMSFRMRELIPVVLLTAAAIALPRLARLAAGALPDGAGLRLAAGGGVLLAVAATSGYVTSIVDHPMLPAAHNQALPNGRLLPFHDDTAESAKPPVQAIQRLIDAQYHGTGHPVVLSARQDLFAYYPYFEFMENNPNYSHPTAQYQRRLDFLAELSRLTDPAQFAARSAGNPFDRIDAFVLKVEGEDGLVYQAKTDNFPNGNLTRTISLSRSLFDEQYFTLTELDGIVVAVRH